MTATIKRRSAEDTRALIQTRLTACPEGMTVADIATSTGISTTTAADHLSRMERDGRARRDSGGFQKGRRQPDTWYATAAESGLAAPGTADQEPDGQPPAADPDAAEEDTAPAASLPAEGADTEPVDLEKSAASPEPLDAEEEEDTPHTAAAGTGGGAPEADSGQDTDPGDAQPSGTGTASGSGEPGEAAADQADRKPKNSANPVSGLRRLRPGELRLLILDAMSEHPDQDYSPTELGHLLQGRSVGAIQNALAAMAKTGEVHLTQEAPRRYRAAT